MTAKRNFCALRVYIFHRKRVTPDHFGVNVYCLDTTDIAGVPIVAADGKSMSGK